MKKINLDPTLKIDNLLTNLGISCFRNLAFESLFVKTSFGNLHYYDSNPDSKDPPIVLIHGIGSSGQSWLLQAAVLKSKIRVLIPDLFQFSGFSRCTLGTLSIGDHARSLMEWFDVLALNKVALCGLSLGGWVSLTIVAARPRLVSKLILLNPGGLSIDSTRIRQTFENISWKTMADIFPGLVSQFPVLPLPGNNFFQKKFSALLVRRFLFQIFFSEGVKNFIETIKMEEFMDNKLVSLTTETLLLWGQKDTLLSSEMPYFFVSKMQNIQGFLVKDCAHILCIESPVTLATCIANFLDLENLDSDVFFKILEKFYPRHELIPIAV